MGGYKFCFLAGSHLGSVQPRERNCVFWPGAMLCLMCILVLPWRIDTLVLEADGIRAGIDPRNLGRLKQTTIQGPHHCMAVPPTTSFLQHIQRAHSNMRHLHKAERVGSFPGGVLHHPINRSSQTHLGHSGIRLKQYEHVGGLTRGKSSGVACGSL